MTLYPAPTGPRSYIGGGNVAGILGVSPYKSPLDEYLTITADADLDRDAATASFFARRKALEPFAVAAFTARTRIPVVAVNDRQPDPEFPWMKAEVDFEPADGGNGEIKTVHPLAAKDWGESGSDQVPEYVVAQVQHGLMVRGRPHAWVHALVGLDEDRIYRIERDDELITMIRAAEIAFWHDHVLPRIPPPPTTAEDVRRLWPRHNAGEYVPADSQLAHQIDQLRQLRAQIRQDEQAEAALTLAIQLQLGEAEGVLDPATGKKLLTWKAQERRGVPIAKLREQYPAIADALTETTTLRVMRLA